jgi:SPFH domain / Band 7 family
MVRLVIELIVGAAILFVAPIFMPPMLRQGPYSLLVRGLGGLIIVYAILSTSYVSVGDGKFAQMFRTIGGGPLAGGKIVAINGENGPQAEILRPGFHAKFLLNVFYDVDTSKTETDISPGKIGVLTAKDGAPLRPGQAFADPFPANTGLTMLDADTFLRNNGQRGPQLTVLPPGKYVLNDYLWEVSIRDASDVNTGFVGVVKSNVWANVDFGTLRADKPDNCDVIGGRNRNEGKIEAPIVPVGCVGVWQASLQPGKYYFNPDAFTIIPIDTRAQVWTYAGGYPRCEITLTVDSKGDITQNRRCADIAVSKENADRAVIVKMEGWDVPLELRVVAQVSPSEASCVVAGVGTLREIEDRVLTPSIRAITRDVAGGTYDVEEPKTDETGKPILVDGKPVIQRLKRPTKVLDLINQRPLIESEIERRIRPEGEKSCVTIREVRLGEPAIPPELLVAVRREQLATQLAKAYVQEQQAQTKRIDSEKAKATADQQPELVKAEIAVQTSQQKALALKNEGQGEKDKLELIALGQKAQTEVLGASATVQLQQYNILMDKLFGFANANPKVFELALTNASKFVPNTYVGSGDGMFGAILGKFLSSGGVAPLPGGGTAER